MTPDADPIRGRARRVRKNLRQGLALAWAASPQSLIRYSVLGPMIKVHRAEGTYLTWLDVTAVAEKIGSKRLADDYNRTKPANMPNLTPEQMIERFFVKTAKVHLNQGAGYGKGGENHMRMNIGTSRKLVELALNNLATACRNPVATNLDMLF